MSTKKSTTASVPVAVAVTAPVAVEAPAVKKATKKVVAPTPVPEVAAPVVIAAPVVAAIPEIVESGEVGHTLQDELKTVHDQLIAIRDAASAAIIALKRVGKRANQDIKEARKSKRKGRVLEEGEVRKPSNFEIPVGISDELSAFFGGGKGALMSRAEVNKRVFAYCKENGLTEGQDIHLAGTPELVAKGFKPSAAAALVKLLAVPEAEKKLTIFNIQTYMRRHYSKPTAAAPETMTA